MISHLTPDLLIKTINQGLDILGKEHSKTKQLTVAADLKSIHLIQELKGEGGFGVVYKTIDFLKSISLKSLQLSAIKVYTTNQDDFEHARNVLLELNPDGSIEGLPRPHGETTLTDTMLTSFCSMELFSNDLKQKNLNEFQNLSIEEKLKLCGQLTSALEHMHKNKWYHGDIKPANCLMKVDPQTKKPIKFVLSDFDGAKKNEKPTMNTQAYELRNATFYSKLSSCERPDVYALSLTIVEILIGKTLESIVSNLDESKLSDENYTRRKVIKILRKEMIQCYVPKKIIKTLLKSEDNLFAPRAKELNAVFQNYK